MNAIVRPDEEMLLKLIRSAIKQQNASYLRKIDQTIKMRGAEKILLDLLVEEYEQYHILLEKDNMNDLAAELVYRANRNGGRDNITVITLEITKEEIDE